MPDRTLEMKLAAIDDSESVLKDLMKDLKEEDLLQIYQILFGEKAKTGTDLGKEITEKLGELNIANFFKFLELNRKMDFGREIHGKIHKVLIIGAC